MSDTKMVTVSSSGRLNLPTRFIPKGGGTFLISREPDGALLLRPAVVMAKADIEAISTSRA